MTNVLLRGVAGLLLIAHGLVHLLYLVDDVPEFSLEGSWVVPAGAARPIAALLMAVTVVASVVLGLAVWGVPVVRAVWPLATVVAAGSSLVLLVAFWSNRLVVGVAIDLAMLAVVVLRPAWTDGLAP